MHNFPHFNEYFVQLLKAVRKNNKFEYKSQLALKRVLYILL